MSNNGKGRRPNVRPVTRIELSEKNIKARWIAIVVLLSIGAVAIGMGLFSALNTQPGWQEIEANPDGPNCSMDFTLVYDFSGYGAGATAANKQLNILYSDATEQAYSIFSPDAQQEGLHNLRYLNEHVNEAVTVEEALYRALEQIHSAGNRNLYLAPVYVEYNRVFNSESEEMAREFDPAYNPEVMGYVSRLSAYANDPEMINLRILGNNTVELVVSDAYLSFAEENEITEFVDFGWMRNAFAADYIAEELRNAGYTCGYLSSYDGFTRNLDTRAVAYSFNIFDRREEAVYLPAQMQYQSPLSIVFLRNYPMDELDMWHYYSYENGNVTTMMIDPADGASKSSRSNLVSYSESAGCAELLLKMIPVFVADEFAQNYVAELTEDGIYSIWCEGSGIYHNDPQLSLKLLADTQGEYYTQHAVNP